MKLDLLPPAVNPRRSLFLCALGAAIGLIIAGFGLFTAKGTRTARVPAEDVAVVNGTPILLSDYIAQLGALYDVSLSAATIPQRRKILSDMIREELFVQRGVELGLQSDTVEVREALVGAVEAQAATDATMAAPTDAELVAYYAAQRADFADEGVMALTDYRWPATTARSTIAAAAAALRAGRPADPAVAALPRTATMADGDEYYFAAKLHLGDTLFAVARGLHTGEVSAPVALPDGIHLLVMAKNVPPVAPPFPAVRDKILAAFRAAEAKSLTAANGRFLRKRADIQIARGFE